MTEATESTLISAEELDRLRAENARLKEQLTSGAEKKPHQGHRWLSVTCAVLAAIMLLASVVTVWARNTMLDTNQYVATVAPLAQDEDVQNAVAARVTEAISAELDFESIAEDALKESLSEEAAVLAGPIASGAENLINEAVVGLVQTQAFERIWEDANRLAHESVVKILTGDSDKGDLVSAAEGKIVLDLAPLADQVLELLGDTFGTDLTSSVDTEDLPIEFTLVESADLADAQDALKLFDTISWLTLILTIAFLVGAVLLAEQRRLGVRRLGLAIVISMVIAGLMYTFARNEYVSGVAEVPNPDAAKAVFDILTRFLHRAIRALLVLGVLTLIGVWVTGPSGTAAKVRAWWDTLLGRASDAGADREVGPVPLWVEAHERSLQIGVAVLAVLAIATWTRPTGLVILFIAIVALLIAAGIRLVAEVARRAGEADGDTPPGDRAPTTPESDEPTPADTVDT
jgi:hypothetical protein